MTAEQIEFAIDTLRRSGRLHMLHGWSFTLGKSSTSDRQVFTAQLTPIGRGSDLGDWEDLGRIVAGVGVPNVETLPASVYNAPNAVHRWEW